MSKRHLPCVERPAAARAGFTLVAVLVIVGSALLVATSLLFIAQAEVAAASHTSRAAQSRALAESALEMVMKELDQQREVILAGRTPELDDQYELWEAGGVLGVVRLLPVTSDGHHLDAQAGKIDLNLKDLSHEALVATGEVDETLAAAILQYREELSSTEGMIGSVAELLQVPGMTAEMLFGPADEMLKDQTSRAEGDLTERVSARIGGAAAAPASGEGRESALADVFTVFAVEPDLQRDGVQRINLNVPWSDQLGARLDERFGDGAGQIVKAIMDEGTAFDRLANLVQVLVRFEVPTEDWADILDGLTVSEETYLFGRLDLNTADEAALLSLPGMSPEQAAAMVRTRESLPEQERATVTWPVVQGIVDGPAFAQWVDRVTTRSWTYRVRLAVGEVDAEDPAGDLVNPVVLEAVIDLAAPQVRVAYLRDVTLLPAAALAAKMHERGNLPEGQWYEEGVQPWAEPGLEEDTAPLTWPDEEESWPIDQLADEVEDAETPAAPELRKRLGRWRGG